jgi:hypothetical protein
MKENDFAISTYGVRIPKIIYGTAWKKDRTAEPVEHLFRRNDCFGVSSEQFLWLVVSALDLHSGLTLPG